MAFVVEFIPDETKERVDFSSLNYPKKGMPDSPLQWVIDKERDIFLISSGNPVGGPDFVPRHCFVLWWGGSFVKIELEYKVTGRFKTGDQDITWSLRGLYPPAELEPRRNEIIASLKEALDAYGHHFRRDAFRHVMCEF
ncbi:MAG: hypothetical protein H7Z12_07320 [Rhodospirillaceae bacterium]|nr:hypothetical protein [Rhodospirillales bacterium]